MEKSEPTPKLEKHLNFVRQRLWRLIHALCCSRCIFFILIPQWLTCCTLGTGLLQQDELFVVFS